MSHNDQDLSDNVSDIEKPGKLYFVAEKCSKKKSKVGLANRQLCSNYDSKMGHMLHYDFYHDLDATDEVSDAV